MLRGLVAVFYQLNQFKIDLLNLVSDIRYLIIPYHWDSMAC